MASVQYDEATRLYPGTTKPAVNELTLSIADGELLVLVGPSGSGKSTALRMLAGLEPLDEGKILKLLDLEPYLDRKPRNLSGGQRQRVAMGRAIVRHPQVYLMDEPLSNLDAKLRVQTRAELVELQQRLAVTTVYVTHDQVEAMTMGHRVAVLRDGDLQQCDTPSILYHEPANLFVAGFIGSPAMNLLPSASGPVRIGGAEIGIADDLGGERATVGFRPETVVIGEGPVAGRIRIVEDLGSEAFVHLLIDHDGEERRIVAKAAAPFAGSPDDNVHFGLRGSVHLFDNAEARRKSVTL